jgi:hypothetical protein
MNKLLDSMTMRAFLPCLQFAFEFTCFPVGWPAAEEDLLFTNTLLVPLIDPLLQTGCTSDFEMDITRSVVVCSIVSECKQ